MPDVPPSLEPLLQALDTASPETARVLAALRPLLVVLDDAARAALPRPLNEFELVAPVLIQAMEDRPRIAASIDFHGPLVTQQILAADKITKILARLTELEQLLADTRLSLLAQAWRSGLQAYGVAKVAEQNDPTLRQVIEPMAEIFKGRRSASTEP